MSDITFTIDGVAVRARPGQSVLKAAQAAGIYIPHLCAYKDLVPHGSCRVCSVRCNGRIQAACVQSATEGMVVENDTAEIREFRRAILDMLFVEGNHFCMFCEKSGMCELQALAYRFGITAPKYPFLFPRRSVDASHPDVLADGNRCIRCGRCVRASRALDGKSVFGFTGRGPEKRLAFNGPNLAATDVAAPDHAIAACPTGTLIVKRVGYKVPIGRRLYDHSPIGSEIEPPAPEK